MKGVAVGVAAASATAAAAVTMPWGDIFKGILGAGGIPPALFLLIVGGLTIAVVVLAQSLKKEQDARDQERLAAAEAANAIQEKRIIEGREMLLALERTATALTTHTVALESRTVTMNELVRGVDNFARVQDENRRYFEGVAKRLEDGLAKTVELLGRA